jgi:hypothetical protein
VKASLAWTYSYDTGLCKEWLFFKKKVGEGEEAQQKIKTFSKRKFDIFPPAGAPPLVKLISKYLPCRQGNYKKKVGIGKRCMRWMNVSLLVNSQSD